LDDETLEDVVKLRYVCFNKLHKLLSGVKTKKTGDIHFKMSADGGFSQTGDLTKRNRKLGRTLWQSAFDAWVRLTSQHHPHLAIDIATSYRESLSMMERRFMLNFGDGFQYYDIKFRKAVAAMMQHNERHGTEYVPDFSVIDKTLMDSTFLGYTPSTCANCGATNHVTEDCTPVLAATTAISVGKAMAVQSNIANSTCYAFNKMFGGKGCTKQPCYHDHSCNTCRGDHPVVECPLVQQKQHEKKPDSKQE
jgi:hypothetical protein